MSTRAITGTVRRMGLEGGLWALQLPDGTLVELVDPPAALCDEGRRAEVTGSDDRAEVSVSMVGDLLRVQTFRWL